MTEYVLPFTCKQAVKVLTVLKWIGLTICPILLIHSFMTNTDFTKELFGHNIPNDCSLVIGFIGTLLLWSGQIIWMLVKLMEENRLPSFKCKCEPDDKTSKEESKT